jgi:hypothetical protein
MMKVIALAAAAIIAAADQASAGANTQICETIALRSTYPSAMRGCNGRLTGECKKLVLRWQADAAREKRRCASAPTVTLPARNPVERAAKQACRREYRSEGSACERCQERETACVVTLIRDVDSYYHKGMKFEATGSGDPDKICQHGGDCLPVSAVRFDHPCLITCENDPDPEFGPACSWESSR